VNNIFDALGYSKACAYWGRQSLVNYNITVREEGCSDLLSRYMADSSCLSHIITDDETLTHHFEPQT